MKISLGVTPQLEETTLTEKGKHFWSGDKVVRGPDKTVGWSVRLKIDFAEEEKAIVSKYDLQEVVLYDQATFTPDEVEKITEEFASNFKRSERAEMAEHIDDHRRHFAQARKDMHLGDFAEYYASFKTQHEAYSHVDFLKERVLPAIKRLITTYTTRQPAEIFEL